MRKAILLLLLLPCALFSQNNLVSVSGIEGPLFSNNDTYFAGSETYAVNVNPTENDKIKAEQNPSVIVEKENIPPSAELLDFGFECGYVKWSTSSETNCSHFLLMFSRDKKSWNILGQIYGAGNSSAKNNYKYPTDLKDVYFKVYQMDFNGDSKEHGPIFGSCKKPVKS